MTDEEAVSKLSGDQEAIDYIASELSRLRKAIDVANIANEKQLQVIYELSDKLKGYDRRGQRKQIVVWQRVNLNETD